MRIKTKKNTMCGNSLENQFELDDGWWCIWNTERKQHLEKKEHTNDVVDRLMAKMRFEPSRNLT